MRLFEFDKKGRNVERVKNVPNFDLYHEVNIILPEIKFLWRRYLETSILYYDGDQCDQMLE